MLHQQEEIEKTVQRSLDRLQLLLPSHNLSEILPALYYTVFSLYYIVGRFTKKIFPPNPSHRYKLQIFQIIQIIIIIICK
jgi:hypothetical protein